MRGHLAPDALSRVMARYSGGIAALRTVRTRPPPASTTLIVLLSGERRSSRRVLQLVPELRWYRTEALQPRCTSPCSIKGSLSFELAAIHTSQISSRALLGDRGAAIVRNSAMSETLDEIDTGQSHAPRCRRAASRDRVRLVECEFLIASVCLSAYMSTLPLIFRAARPIVRTSAVWPRRKPSLSASSRIATSGDFGQAPSAGG